MKFKNDKILLIISLLSLLIAIFCKYPLIPNCNQIQNENILVFNDIVYTISIGIFTSGIFYYINIFWPNYLFSKKANNLFKKELEEIFVEMSKGIEYLKYKSNSDQKKVLELSDFIDFIPSQLDIKVFFKLVYSKNNSEEFERIPLTEIQLFYEEREKVLELINRIFISPYSLKLNEDLLLILTEIKNSNFYRQVKDYNSIYHNNFGTPFPNYEFSQYSYLHYMNYLN